MIHITRNKKNGTIIHAEPGRILLNLGSNVDENRTEGLLKIVDEILTDLKDKKFRGKFKFEGDLVHIELCNGKDKRQWTKPIN